MRLRTASFLETTVRVRLCLLQRIPPLCARNRVASNVEDFRLLFGMRHGRCMKHTPSPRDMEKDAHPQGRALGTVVVRLGDAMAHVNRYAFKGVSRLARDAGLSPSSISRILSGKQSPSFLLVARLTDALEAASGRKIDPRELVSENGRFPTQHICKLMSCGGCLPENALDEFGDVKPTFKDVRRGEWVTSRHPRGFDEGKAAGKEGA